jgi:hypothetical protein
MEVDDFSFRRRESYLAWKDVGGTDGSVLVEMDKTNDLLGLVVDGRSEGLHRKVIVHSIIPGSAADLDGFIQPGFELLKVDSTPLKGKTQQEVASILLSCYTSDRNTIKLLVNPPGEA